MHSRLIKSVESNWVVRVERAIALRAKHLNAELVLHMQVKFLTEYATMPTRASAGAAGFDLASAVNAVVPAKSRMLIATDLAIMVPDGTYGQIKSRSGLASKQSIDVGAGVIDSDYRGNVSVLLINDSDKPFQVTRGDRIAQLLLVRIAVCDAERVQELPDSKRGAAGFGSSGV